MIQDLDKKKIENCIENSLWDELKISFMYNVDEWVAFSKKAKWFRTAKYDYNPEIGFHILSALLNIDYSEDVEELIAALNHANIKDKDYVKSCIFLLDVSKEVHKSYKEIEKMDKMYPFVVFVNDRYAKCSPHKEEIADNLSCILASHNQFFADLELNTKKSFECVLQHASWIRYYKDLEQLLFNFNCRLECNGNDRNLYELNDAEHWLESLTYGFCKYETQSLAKIQLNDVVKRPTFEERVEDFIKEKQLKWIVVRKNFFEFSSSINNSIQLFADELGGLFSEEYDYKDELLVKTYLSSDLHISPSQMKVSFINKEFSIRDVIVFRRILVFISMLIKYSSIRKDLCLMAKKDCLNLFFKIAGNVELEKLCNLLVFGNNSTYVDIQYTPFFDYDADNYLIPMEIMCCSNVFRNLMKILKNKARLDGKGEKDLINDKYEQILKKIGIPFYRNFDYGPGELDLVYALDGEVFISENKNMLPPTSFQEAQNVKDDYNDALDQKNRFMQLYAVSDSTLISKLNEMTDLNIDFTTHPKIHFYLTFGNRFALLKNTRDFPVVYINEIITMMDNKPKIISCGDFRKEIPWREHDELHAVDIANYLSDERKTPDINIATCEKRISNKIIKYKEMQLTLVKML